MSSEEEDIICSSCNNQTEQALILMCDHKLCFNCANKLLKTQHIDNYNTHQYIECSLCQTSTLLEPDTIRQILNDNNIIDNMEDEEENRLNNPLFMNANKYNNKNYLNLQNDNNNLNDIDNNLNKNNKYNQNEIINNISTSEINIINDLTNYKQLCKEHSEPFTYLCLDCMSNCICAECVVHGIHRDHEVLNIKKAYPLIYKKLEDLSKYANDQKKSILLINETISKKKKCINDLIERCKSEIHNTFEQIKLKLDNKEKEIVNNTTNILNKSIDELDNYDITLQKNSGNLEDIIVRINNILRKKDELNIINYFCENKNKILEECELQKINFIPNLDTFTNIKIEPNKITFNNMIKGINNFKFNITNIKGLEMGINQPNKIVKNNQKMNIHQPHYDKITNTNNNYMNQYLQMNFNDMNNNNNNIYYTEMPNDLNEFNNKIPNFFNNNAKKIRPRTAKPSKRKNKVNNKNNMNNISNQNNMIESNNNEINFDYNFS